MAELTVSKPSKAKSTHLPEWVAYHQISVAVEELNDEQRQQAKELLRALGALKYTLIRP